MVSCIITWRVNFCRRRRWTDRSSELTPVSFILFLFYFYYFNVQKERKKNLRDSHVFRFRLQFTSPSPTLRHPSSRPTRRQILRPLSVQLRQRVQQRSPHASLGCVHHPASGESEVWSWSFISKHSPVQLSCPGCISSVVRVWQEIVRGCLVSESLLYAAVTHLLCSCWLRHFLSFLLCGRALV